MTHKKKRVAVLISGRGSNMMSLIAAAREPNYPAEIVCVISNRPEAEGLKKAEAQGIAARAIDHKAYANKQAFEADLDSALKAFNVDLVVCAGFMRLMTADFVERWRDRMLNVHPSLLPAFKGLDTHARVLSAGAKITGCTVHIVRPQMDEGPIIAQAAVPVVSGDTPESLSARVLKAEHRLYPHALAMLASGAVEISGENVFYRQVPPDEGKPLFWPPL